MSAQVTEAHRKLVAAIIRDLSIDDGAELIADSEAQAVAAAVTALTCTHHNDKQRAECPVCLVVALTAERDQLRAELAKERARRDDLVADINDACITLESAIADCDDYALQNTEFKLTAVRDVLLQYIPNAAMKEGAK